MPGSFIPKTINRIIDANINRAKEGLRVCEEITRFMLNSRSLTLRLKQTRHVLDALARALAAPEDLIRERFASHDIGKNIYINELKRKNAKDIFFANLQRVKESMRVLEEFSKLKDTNLAVKFKETRYKLYEIEKKAAFRISALCHS